MSTKLALTSGGSGAPFPEDVFASWVYDGSATAGVGPTQNIVNGINLSAFGGMVWTKIRTNGVHILTDTVRGVGGQVSTTTGYEAITAYGNSFSSFNSNGYTLGIDNNGVSNVTPNSYNSWTFRRAQRFFDVVTYTGNGAARTISHSLGVAPGFMLVKRTDGTGGAFLAYHRSVGAGRHYSVNGAGVSQASTTMWNNTAPTEAVFSLGNDLANTNAAPYVAYLFAHDTLTDNIIQCGSYTGNGSTAGPTVALGWEPQFLLIKNESGANNWTLLDSLRGLSTNNETTTYPNANTADTAIAAGYVALTPTGFQLSSANAEVNASANNYVYIAIRRPMKRPTAGTQVFTPEIHASPGAGGSSTITAGFPVDLFLTGCRNQAFTKMWAIDRLRGGATSRTYLATSQNGAENVGGASVTLNRPTTVSITDSNGSWNGSIAGTDLVVDYSLRRARGFFEVVCYSGTGANTTVQHGLGVVPELIIVKQRLGSNDGAVYASGAGATQRLALFASTGSAQTATDSTAWNNTAPTATAFSLGSSSQVNGASQAYVAYLFATLAGISKVGSYTGNGGTSGSAGTSQTISCGFTTGARFVLIKRTDATGDWYVWDTARGIVAANDPRISLNSINAEVGTDDSLDPDNTGFIVNQLAATNINVTGATYIYLAIA